MIITLGVIISLVLHAVSWIRSLRVSGNHSSGELTFPEPILHLLDL